MSRNGRMPRAVEGDHNTRLTLAVHPSDEGMCALAVGEGAADWLSAAAKGPTVRFPDRLFGWAARSVS